MARRSAYLREIDPVPPKLEAHMVALGFDRSEAYLDWCYRHGFDYTLEKSNIDLREESEAREAERARRAAHANIHRKPKAFLKAVCEGDLFSEEIDRPKFKQAAAAIEASREDAETRASLLEMLTALSAHGDFIFDVIATRPEAPVLNGLIKLHDRKAQWLRPLEEWKPKSKNTERMFGELAHYLFDEFGDVPRFMERVWLRQDRPSWRYRDWFVHLGRGHNLRKAKTPIPLTKKMAHHFGGAPDDYSVEQALRWAQMKALGCPEAAIHAVAASRLGRSLANDDFWFTFLRFIADNPMLDPRQIAPVIDYLHNQRFEPVEIEAAPGEWRQEPPPQPGLSLHGRTVGTLLRQVEEWHKSLGRIANLPSGQYALAEFEGYSLEREREARKQLWVIRQLRSAKDLQIESDELRHCVASYHWSCAKGHCTIWNLSVTEAGGKPERRQTIEVDANGKIVQCRGLANRDPTSEEWSIVNRWAGERGLSVASYL